jgi:hypothetical protein
MKRFPSVARVLNTDDRVRADARERRGSVPVIWARRRRPVPKAACPGATAAPSAGMPNPMVV